MMMQPAPVVRAGIRALEFGRISVVPGWANTAVLIFTWATPRWLHQALFARVMDTANDRADTHAAPVKVARDREHSNDITDPVYPQL